jgi:replicative DNA helicase
MSVLGCIFFAPDTAWDDARQLLTEHKFYQYANRLIFRSLGEMIDKNKAIDIVTFVAYLKKKKIFDDCGGYEYLHKVAECVPSAWHLAEYAKVVDDKWRARELNEICGEALQETHEGCEIGELVGRVETKIFDLQSEKISEVITAVQAVRKWMQSFDSRKPRETVPTGLGKLDELIHGFRNGQMTIVGARPSIGKSALALNLCLAANAAGKGAYLATLEPTAHEIAERLISIKTEIPVDRLERDLLNADEAQNVLDACAELEKVTSRTFIDEAHGWNVGQIISRARSFKRKFGISLVIVDYLQKVDHEDRRIVNREQQIATISRRLNNLAKQTNLAVVLLAALSREAEKNEGKPFKAREPKLWHLRESGSIEQDADLVILMHRNKVVQRDAEGKAKQKEPLPSECQLIVAKNRNGPTGDCMVHFSETCFKFSSQTQMQDWGIEGGPDEAL